MLLWGRCIRRASMPLFFLLAFALLLAACKIPLDERQAVAELKKKVSALEQQNKSASEQLERQKEELSALQLRFNDARDQILKQAEELRQLKHNQAALQQQLLALSKRNGGKNASKAVSGNKADDEAAGSDTVADQLYARALSSYRNDDYVTAVKLFAAYLRDFPRGAKAANARYWLGESYYSLAQYAQAITEFSRVCKDFPTSSKVPGAKLKIAMAYEAIGSREPARAAYRDLLKKFPGTASAQRAEKALARLE